MARPLRFYMKRVIQFTLLVVFVAVASLAILFFSVTAPPDEFFQKENSVNDVTQLNPIDVGLIKRPETIEEIVELLKDYEGAVSIGGARHSMGGQIATEKSLHLDMTGFNKVVAYHKERKEITVQSGVTWRKIQEYIDPDDLSVKIMQTYANFTVGGSLSVNVHGRYIGEGPLIYSVKSIKIVLASGDVLECSPTVNSELFYGCIGGYGGLAVIVEATLMLEDNCKVERVSGRMPLLSYYDFFMDSIRGDTSVIFHNADIYPDGYHEVRPVSYIKTNRDVTVPERLKPFDQNYRAERFAMWLVSELSCGQWIRRNMVDPVYYRGQQVKWRNYEASFDAMELEPTSRVESTYVLQEYFVPINQFNSFVPKMTAIFQKHEVNVINISIRHARKDPGSMLAWASDEVFCFVVYYKQDTDTATRRQVVVWTRELIDLAIAHKGSYYLPYQIHATTDQFASAYPNSIKFFELKKRVDPTNKFRNKLWDAYFPNELFTSQ